jgi:hypothetical protein
MLFAAQRLLQGIAIRHKNAVLGPGAGDPVPCPG